MGSPMGCSLVDKKKRKQNSKKVKRSSTLNVESKASQSKFEVYQKSFLGRAVGNLV
jgi:hypothetical protein